MERVDVLAGVDSEIQKQLEGLADLLTARGLLSKQFGIGIGMLDANWANKMFGVGDKVRITVGPESEVQEIAGEPSTLESITEQVAQVEAALETVLSQTTEVITSAPAVKKTRPYTPRGTKLTISTPAKNAKDRSHKKKTL